MYPVYFGSSAVPYPVRVNGERLYVEYRPDAWADVSYPIGRAILELAKVDGTRHTFNVWPTSINGKAAWMIICYTRGRFTL